MKKILCFPILTLALCALFSLTACEQHSADTAKLLLKKKAKHGEKHDKGHDHDYAKTEKEAAEWEKQTMEDEPHGESDHHEAKKEAEPKATAAPSPAKKAAPLFPSSKPTKPERSN